VLSIATGHDVGYLTGPVAGGREGYYTGAVAAGEPAGLWYGAGAEDLGLAGEVNAELMEAVYTQLLDPRDPAAHNRATWGEAAALAAGHRSYRSAEQVYAALLENNPGAGPERRAELRAQAERSARQAVSFIDATFSAPKSVTVMGVAFERAANDARTAGDEAAAAAWTAHQRAVEDAVLAGARASLDYLQEHAGYSRVGHHGGGAGRWIDAHRFVVAQFLQHDSRDRDPQLHVHQAILNRVLCADGIWRTLDSRAIHTLRAAAAAIGERVMEAHLTGSLGVEFATRPDGRAREVLGITQAVLDLFSSRRRAVTAKTADLLAEFRQRYAREPSAAERFHLCQQATLATRAGKSHDGETRAEQLDRWTTQCANAVAGGLAQVARDVLDRAQHARPATTWSPRDVISRALAGVADTKQAWTRSALLRAISDALPGNLRLTPDEIQPLLDGLTDTALTEAVPVSAVADTTHLPAAGLLDNGQSAHTAPGAQLWTTTGVLSAEHALRAAAVTRGAPTLSAAEADAVVTRFADSGRELGADQAATLRGVLTSGAYLEVLSAAAGTGKSFTIAALAQAWTEVQGRRVVGLAPSQVAAGVLAEDGVTATNTAVWLGAQHRLNTARPGTTDTYGDERWRLRPGDLVVVDEAGMATTDQLAEIQQHCEQAGAKLLLTGDPRQLAAVGAGGAMADLAEHGIRYELAEVRRFTADWERSASLRLRDADRTVLADYAKHGRLIDGGTAEQAEAAATRAWLADTLTGRESLLLVGSNDAAARVSASLRAELVALGHVAETGVALSAQGTVAGVGDLVQARHNGWDLIGYGGNTTAPVNRETYRVTGLRPDGGLTVTPHHHDAGEERASIALPAGYVAEHLALGYASTVHAAQGRTTDTAHAVLGAATDATAAYVAMTRGRDRNTAWTITRPVAADAPTGQTLTTTARTAAAVLGDVLDRAREALSALAEQAQARLAAVSAMTHLDQLIDHIGRHVTPGRAAATLDRLTAHGVLTDTHRAELAADDAFGSLERLLRTAELAGHDPDAVLTAAVTGHRSLDDARSPAQVLHHRITHTLRGRLTSHITSAADLIPTDTPPEWTPELHARAEAADTRRHQLGTETAATAPRWAVDALGPVPDDLIERAEWEQRAGWAAAWRELVGRTDDTDPLGPAPPAGVVEKAALFRAAHHALNLLDAGAEEAELSDGQLRARHRALAREETWAPRWVDEDLAAIHEQAEKARIDHQVWLARAEVTADPDERDRLRSDAYTARQTAQTLAVRAEVVEQADRARGAWYAHTAVTRDNAHRARAELAARGIDPDDPAEQVTAQEWLDAHRATQDVEDAERVIGEHDLHDETHTTDVTDQAAVPTTVAETGVADIRATSTPDAGEAADPTDRHRVPTVEQVTADVARAQAALTEITTRQAAEADQAARLAAEAARREQLTRWAEHDDTDTTDRDTEAAVER